MEEPSSGFQKGRLSSPEQDLTVPGLDLTSLPPILVVSAHFKNEEEETVKSTLRRHGAALTADVSKAKRERDTVYPIRAL